MTLVPMVIEQTNRGERSFYIYSRLLKDRKMCIRDSLCGYILQNVLYVVNMARKIVYSL